MKSRSPKLAPPPGAEKPLSLEIDPSVQSVQMLADFHARAEQSVNPHQRRIESLLSVLGRPRTLYVLLALVLAWMLFNEAAPRLGLTLLDPPPFFWLQGLIGLFALLMTTMVLITQNRQGKMAARRALLDLHVNLLSEQKITKLIALIEELRRDLPSVDNRHDPQAEAMQRSIDPQAVIAKLEAHIKQAIAGQSGQPTEAEVARGLAENVADTVREARVKKPVEKD